MRPVQLRVALAMSVILLMSAVALASTIPASSVLPKHVAAYVDAATPVWTKDLVIYEVATKSFTSPAGPASGTFASLEQQLAYLQELGISGIWLTGHSVSDPHHFYNIWTQYAVVEPDQIDASLGTPEQFKAMIDEAHRRGIKIFLDTITHGVMRDSSLVKQHPEWFRGGSYGMIDYDWKGGHTDLDEWWVKLWSEYVTQYGVDGFRLDVDIYRPDLWARIRENAATAGHPIVVFIENLPVIPGVTDFTQAENRISDLVSEKLNPLFTDDIPLFYHQKFALQADYDVAIQYMDDSHVAGSTRGNGPMRVNLEGFTTNRVSRQSNLPGGRSELHLVVGDVPNNNIKTIVVTRVDDTGRLPPGRWIYGHGGEGEPLKMEGSPPALDLYLSSFYGYSPSIQLSCHDNGWTGFPSNESPYAARGSRSIFGYSFLLTPMIPIFMAGEEFDASFHALPDLSPDLYGGRDPGKGRWLYGGQLDWAELEQPLHRAMLEDVKRMMAIRKQERAVLAAEIPGDAEPRLIAVPYRSDVQVPAPYMRWKGNTGIVVAANRSKERDAILRLALPLNKLAPSSDGRFKVTDLWNGGKPAIRSTGELGAYSLKVKRDNVSRGGLAILKVEALQ